MLAVADVLKAVAERGSASQDELEAAISCPPNVNDGFLTALDAAMDHGYLRLVGWQHGGEGCYRLTGRGRRLLQAAQHGHLAA